MSSHPLIKIAITLPGLYAAGPDADACIVAEARRIERMLDSGTYQRVHIRKPEWREVEIAALLSEIRPDLRCRLSLHSHFQLADEFGVGGVHLNSRCPQAPTHWTGIVSRSTHSVEEALRAKEDYVFLSPLFPSVSKPGYGEDSLIFENFKKLTVDKPGNVIGLGGVHESLFTEMQAAGFAGAAMLGNAWRPEIPMREFSLQYISDPSVMSYAEQVKAVAQGGCRWVQYRHKGADESTLIEEGKAIAKTCKAYGCIYVVDDHVSLVDKLGADGVHLGKNDMDVAAARQILGPTKIIGATANNADDILAAWRKGADYIGLGPFRFTTTKSNLSPTLGLEGYRNIVEKVRNSGCRLPIVAIGGITIDDVAPILSAGVNGVAVSGSILRSENPTEATIEFCRILTHEIDG